MENWGKLANYIFISCFWLNMIAFVETYVLINMGFAIEKNLIPAMIIENYGFGFALLSVIIAWMFASFFFIYGNKLLAFISALAGNEGIYTNPIFYRIIFALIILGFFVADVLNDTLIILTFIS